MPAPAMTMTTSRPPTDRPWLGPALLVPAILGGLGRGHADGEPTRPAPPAAIAATVTPAPLTACSIAIAPGEGPAMLARLDGQQARLVADLLIIDDIAGEGRPWVGVIERHGAALWLRTADGPLLLDGPLARPRIAGPGYRAWATGVVDDAHLADAPPRLRLRRLGVLARP